MRYALGVEYNGTQYHGWQKQIALPSVQACLEKAIACVANHPVSTVCAGRTDAGVHALHQIVHFDTDAIREDHAWLFGINRYLPSDINVSFVRVVSDEFHARYAALARRYGYVMQLSSVQSSLLGHSVTWIQRKLTIDAMREAAAFLVGTHDFSAFRAQECQAKTAIRTIYHLELIEKSNLLIMDIKANAFLHHMVRNIVGVLLAIGRGDKPVQWAQEVLLSGDRRQAGMTTPPTGLHFIGVDYPVEFMLPSRPEFIWFLD